MSRMYLSGNASRARVQTAERARRNRAEIVRELSWGRVSRRDLIKWGLFTGAGLLAPIGGLNPFVCSAAAMDDSGIPRSPLFGCRPFTQPMPRFDVLPRLPVAALTPAPTAQSNQTQQVLNPLLGTGTGPIEGRPPGAVWAHQRFADFLPAVAIEVQQKPACDNAVYNPQCDPSLNSGIDPSQSIPLKFHPGMPTQNPSSVWTFNGCIPPKLVQGRYGE